jgi:hypothetical protein
MLIAGLAAAPVAGADNRHGQEHWHGGRAEHHCNNVAPAIIGGLIGLGVGAAIASGGYGYYAPPPVYYTGRRPAITRRLRQPFITVTEPRSPAAHRRQRTMSNPGVFR